MLTLVWAALLLGERITPAAMIAAALVLVFVIATRRAPVRPAASPRRSVRDSR